MSNFMRHCSDSDGRGAMYGDYFDDDAESDYADEDEVDEADGAGWDGQDLYDTGEGREGARRSGRVRRQS